MSVEENKTIVRHLFEGESEIDEVFAPDVITYSPTDQFQGTAVTSRQIKQEMASFHTAFPDFHYTIEDLIAEGDKVVVRATARGTHQDDVMTRLGKASATGKKITYAIIFIFSLVNGKIVESWDIYDDVTRLEQLGVLPR